MEGIMEHCIDERNIRLFIEKLTELERSSLTVEKYARDVMTFRRWVGSDGHFDKSNVIRFKQVIREKYRLSSANSMLSALNKFFQLMGWEDCRIRTFKTQRASFRNEEKELSVEEYQRLLKAAKEKGDLQILSIMETIASTGIRISELPFITVASVSTRRALVSLKGKSRQVLIPAELSKKLRLYCRERKITSGSIFVTRTGRPIDRSNILHRMKALSTAAKVNREKIFPHNLRHFFAVNYYKAEKDIVRLADLLGHANINTTRIYYGKKNLMTSCTGRCRDLLKHLPEQLFIINVSVH